MRYQGTRVKCGGRQPHERHETIATFEAFVNFTLQLFDGGCAHERTDGRMNVCIGKCTTRSEFISVTCTISSDTTASSYLLVRTHELTVFCIVTATTCQNHASNEATYADYYAVACQCQSIIDIIASKSESVSSRA